MDAKALAAHRDELVETIESLAIVDEVKALESVLRMRTESQLSEAGWNDQPISAAQIKSETGWSTPGAQGQYLSLADDYRDGQCLPLYQSERDLDEIRGIGRWFASTDETAAAITTNLRNYIIGKGFDVRIEAKDKLDAPLAAEVQEFVEEFLDLNDWTDEGESEALLQTIVDGELLLRLRPNRGTPPVIELIGGEHLTQPNNPRDLEDYYGLGSVSWTFGVATPHGAPHMPQGYFVDWFGNGSDWEFIKWNEAVFVKRNTPRFAKRGVSDFAIPYRTMERGGKLFANTVLGATIQASIAGIRKAAKGTPASSLPQANNALRAPLNAVRADGRAVSVTGETFLGGKIINTASDWMHGPMGSPQGPTYIEIHQACLRRVGSRWAMPEYMISGDASNANYASTMVAESPFVQNTIKEQGRFAKVERKLIWRAIDMEAKRGRFGGYTADELYRRLTVAIEPPNPVSRNPLEEEGVYDKQQAAGVLSRKTRAAKAGLDYEQEIENGAAVAQPVATPNPVSESRIQDLRFSLLEGGDA